ncbi:hypothetical protein G6F56_004905 [Rhizopus delemar]|nr:hypothetical protein G6F56_004905 [Rhizopus delemar]
MAISFAWFLALYHYLVDGTLPMDCDKKIRQRIQYQAKKWYVSDDGDLLEVGTGRKLLHKGNALEVVTRIHVEGHFGVLNTLEKVNRYYVLAEGRELVNTVVKSCETCQFRARIKAVRSNPGVVMKTPRHPFFMVGVDAVGPLNTTRKGNRYMLTGVDYLTRWPMAVAVPDINEETTVEFFYHEIVKNYGVPQYILSDRGANFISTYVHYFLRQIGCRNVMTTSYRPQVNGMCERLNQSLVQTIAKISRKEESGDQWDKFVDVALMVLRSTANVSTGFTPGYLLFGYEFRTPAVWEAPREDFVEGEEELALRDRVAVIQNKIEEVRRIAREKSDESKAKAKVRYDRRVVDRKRFEVGEQVLMKDNTPASKFADKWLGPYEVLRVNQNGTYHLTGKNSQKLKYAVNGDRLKVFDRSVTHLVPEVMTEAAQQQFRSWVDSRKNPAFLGMVKVITEEETRGGVRDKLGNSSLRPQLKKKCDWSEDITSEEVESVYLNWK